MNKTVEQKIIDALDQLNLEGIEIIDCEVVYKFKGGKYRFGFSEIHG